MTKTNTADVSTVPPGNNEEKDIQNVLKSILHKGVKVNIYSHITYSNKAIKEILLDGLEKTKLMALKVSYQTLARMRHPNIINSDPPIEYNGRLYIKMDRYFTSLEAMMCAYKDKRLQFSKSQVLVILTQISSALVYLHRSHKESTNGTVIPGTAHGRLKPTNILVSENGKCFVLSDAGVHNDRQGLSNAGYTAPELLSNANATPEADMWSLGVIIYELMAGNKSDFLSGRSLESITAESWEPDLSLVSDKFITNVIRCLLVPNPEFRMSSVDLSFILQNGKPIADIEDYFRQYALKRSTTRLVLKISRLHNVLKEKPLSQTANCLTTLMQAARAGNITLIKQLVDAGSGVRAQDTAGLTALIHATLAKQYGAIRILAALEHSIYDCNGQTALMHAAQMNDPRAIHLIAQYEAGLKTKRAGYLADISVKSRTALMGAAAQGFTQAVEALIQYESRHRDEMQRTALMYAASQNHLKEVQLLASREGGLQDHMNQTALMIAVQCGNKELVPFLLCEVGIKNSMGYTALMIAADKGYFEIAQHLVEHERGMRSLTQSTALITAAYRNCYEIVQLLIPYESKSQNRHGLTAMMEAAKHGHADVVKILVDHEKGIKDNQGRTALTIASKFGHSEIADFLSHCPEEHCILL